RAANALPSDGTAVAANRLATPRNINGVPFDGTQDINITSGITQQDADSRYIQDIRLGAENRQVMYGGTYYSAYGNVMAGLQIDSKVDASNDFIAFRPLQKLVGGTWITVSQL
ncbi:phage tail protein, partial [Escherichia coli]|nr:phage tail protein [Escherichia coli]